MASQPASTILPAWDHTSIIISICCFDQTVAAGWRGAEPVLGNRIFETAPEVHRQNDGGRDPFTPSSWLQILISLLGHPSIIIAWVFGEVHPHATSAPRRMGAKESSFRACGGLELHK